MNDIYVYTIISLLGLLVATHPLILNVLLSLIAAGYGNNHRSDRLRIYTLSFVGVLAALALTFLASATWLLSVLSANNLQTVSLLLASWAILWGAMELAGLYLKQPLLTLPADLHHALHRKLTKRIDVTRIIRLAVLTGGASLFVLGPALLALCSLFILNGLDAPLALIWLAVVLLLPSVALAGLAVHGTKLSVLRVWIGQSVTTLRAISGLTSVVIGWLVLMSLLRGGLW